MSATYSGDGSYDADDSTNHQVALAYEVDVADTTVNVSPDPSPSVSSEPVTITADIDVDAPGAGSPTGTVDFSDAGGALAGCTGRPVSGGSATCTISTLPVGTTTVFGLYSGDSNFNSATSSAGVTVTTADTSTTVSGAPNPSTWAQDVVYTATVSAVSPATATPDGGTVDFKSDTVPITGCQDVPVSAGTADCATALSPTGAPQITGEYSGDVQFNASVSPAYFQVVNQASSSTSLSSAPNPSVFSQPVTFTAAVTSGSGSPTGTVAFKIGSTTISGCGTRAILAGEATCTTATLSFGTTAVTAVYAGDTNFVTSTSTPHGQVVGQAESTTTVASDDDSSIWQQAVTFTATVASTSPATGTVGVGSVSFATDGDPIPGCNAQPVTAGTATCTTSDLPVGSGSITADFVGTTDYAASSSAPIGQAVAKAATTTEVASGANPSVVSQPVTFTATVTSSAGTPTGTVEFKAGSSTITGCAAKTLTAGAVTCSTATLPLGDTSITATFAGNTNLTTSTTAAPVTQTVTKALTTTGVTSNDATTDWHQSVTFTATVAPTPAATVAPSSGTVSFNAGGTAITGCGTRPVGGGGTATCTTDTLPIGPTSVTAVYSGNTDYLGSTSSAYSQTVSPAPSVVSVASSLPTSRFGQRVTIDATVTSTAGTPTGTLSFYAVQRDATRRLLATKTLDGDGKASTTTSTLPVRTHAPIVADYEGTTLFAASESTMLQTVNRSNSRTLLTSSANPSKAGRAVTFTVHVNAMAPGGGVPKGTVAFYRGTGGSRTSLGLRRLVDGSTTLRVPVLPVGVDMIVAEYHGGANHRASSRSIQHRVKS